MSFKVEKLESGQVKLGYDWAFEQIDKEALALFGELSVQRGEELERSRIIKLLEEMAKMTIAGDTWHINPFEYAIALIKGEQE